MKVIVLLLSFVVFCQSSPVTLFREVAPGDWTSENITKPLRSITVKDQDILIYFRSQLNPNSKTPIDLTNPAEVKKEGYSNKKDTVFVIHGWRNEYDSPICEEVTEAILKIKDANVFVVDWSALASNLYIIAHSAVPNVAKIVSKLIDTLIRNYGLDLDRTVIVGHSLGAHIAGLCGADLKGQLNHIVGLDPAFPLYEFANEEQRLDPTDAKFVQVIHTCAGLLGFNRNVGHVDYWPNGGSNQPGCGGLMDIGGTCSHGRSYHYFAESIVSSGFISNYCGTYDDYLKGYCKTERSSLMGEYNPDKEASGSYFLSTNSKSPYAQH